ncbi:alpha/beta fold hydrolase [uncultured Jatrophihabitans sp.]|uniref:alpha/beta fold hydrolase n=1 Tax=uncultured Jatrophihabitans sp. TaxID=1610747 RepID=UPI0035CB2ED4
MRFDNRDVGRSTSFSGPGPSPVQLLTRRAPVTYRLEDMADDTAGLIRHVAPAGAHVVGVSLGSMIAQATAIRHRGLVRSLVSIMGRAAIREEGDGSGNVRQLAAILAERDRTAGLRGYDRPSMVIHGDRDRIILPSGGRATAAALPQGELLILEGMGHDLARRLWPVVLDGIERTVRRSETAGTKP